MHKKIDFFSDTKNAFSFIFWCFFPFLKWGKRGHQTKNALLCLDTSISSCYKTVAGMGFHSFDSIFEKNI